MGLREERRPSAAVMARLCAERAVDAGGPLTRITADAGFAAA